MAINTYSGRGKRAFEWTRVRSTMQAADTARRWQVLLAQRIRGIIAGPHYGQFVPPNTRDYIQWRPVSPMQDMIRTHLPHLAPREVAPKVTGRVMGARGYAKLMEARLALLARELDLAHTFRLGALEALISGAAWYEVGLTQGARLLEIRGELQDVGQEYVSMIPVEDRLVDPMSRSRNEDSLRAARRIVSKTWIEENFEGAVVDKIRTLNTNRTQNGPGGIRLDGSSDTISASNGIAEMVQLYRVVIYDGNRVYEGLAPSMDEGNDWIIPPREFEFFEGGPFVEMSFINLPSNRVPISVTAQQLDKFEGRTLLAAHMLNQALLAKSIGVYKGDEGKKLAMEIRDATDKSWVRGDASTIGTIDTGGVLAHLYGANQWLIDEGNTSAANMTATAGNKGVADTATEAAYLQSNAMGLLGDMRDAASVAMGKVLALLGKSLDTRPQRENVSLNLSATDIAELVYDPETKEADWHDLMFDVHAWQAVRMDPAVEQQQFTQMIGTIAPLAQQVALMGGNVDAFVGMMAEKFNMPELSEIFPSQDAMQTAMAMQQLARPPQPGQPAQGADGLALQQSANAAMVPPKGVAS